MLATVFAPIWFSVYNFILRKNTRYLYRVILENEKIVKEMKKSLHAFPSSVLIWPSMNGHKFNKPFTNKHFDKNISKMKKNVNKLKNIKVVLSNDEKNDITSNLHQFLIEQQQSLGQRNITREN